MFKRKQKKSHKNDEIYIDYSKDVDVKKKDEDLANPEHYKALEVQDEIVVSTVQIKEAKQQELQDDFIKQREKEEVIKKDEATNEESLAEEPVDNPLTEESVEDYEALKDGVPQEDDESDVPQDSYLEQEKEVNELPKERNEQDVAYTEDDTIDDDSDESEHTHPIYPSFLREEFEERSKVIPIKNTRFTEDVPTEQIDKGGIEEDPGEKDDENHPSEALDNNDAIEESTAKKQDLHSYFQQDASVLKSGVKKQYKQVSHKKEKQAPLYQYKHHQFYAKEEFVAFLEANMLDLEHIAQGILNDEQFFRWLKEESTLFEDSIIKMKKFKQELKQ